MNNNTYLKFDKNRMVNLEYSLEREILRANRRGAYHCTTLVECNTRKQHGLLVMPVPALGDTNHVLLSSFDETVIQHGAEFNLGIHKYDGNNYSPMGHKYIREFNCDSTPKTIYRVGGVVLSKEKMFSLKDNAIFIRYTLIEAHSPTTIRFKPFLAFREINKLTLENSTANHGYREVENGISMCMYSGYPNLYIQSNKQSKFVFNPHWNKGIEYQKDKEAGLPYKEDLYVPGYFELPIEKGESIIFSAGDTEVIPSELAERFENGLKVRTPRSSFFNCLKNSAHQFYFRPNADELYLLDSYPWGRVSARSQFATLPGLTLCIGKNDEFEEIVDTAIPSIYTLIAGDRVDGFLRDIDTPDVLLWLTQALKYYSKVDKERFLKKYSSLVKDIVHFILKKKHPNLHLLGSGLLHTEANSSHLSWVGGDTAGLEVLNRSGCMVEINTFWYNALMFNLDIAQWQNDDKLEVEMQKWAGKVKKSFNETFVNNAGYLFDSVDGKSVDWSVRPDMIYAVSSDYALLEKHKCKSILDIVTKELLTPKGIRSLSPKSQGFKPRYEGSFYDKMYSQYNGCAWPGLLGYYAEAYAKIFQRSGHAFLSRQLMGIEEEMANDCIASLSQVYDGSLPYRGHGAVSSALSVAGVLRALELQRSFEDEY